MMKEWQSGGVIVQVSHESNWKQASWEEKEGKGAYKRRGGAVEKGFRKIEREDLDKNKREKIVIAE